MDTKILKYEGCLIGLAIGDAMGSPLKGMKPGFIIQTFGEIDGFVDVNLLPVEKSKKRKVKGLYMNDTQQALAAADVLINEQAMKIESLSEIYLRMYNEGEPERDFGFHRGCGKAFREAVLQMQQNPEDLLCCGINSHNNDEVSRNVPDGLFYHDNDDDLIKAVIEASIITNKNPCVIGAAATIAKAISMLFSMQPESKIDVNEFCKTLSVFTRKAEEVIMSVYYKFLDKETRITSGYVMSDSLSIIPSLVRESDDQLARSSIINEANRHLIDEKISSANSDYAPATALISLYYFLKYKDFRKAVCAAISEGKDADSAGSVTGALCGTYSGIEGIPEEYIDELIGADQIFLRAEALMTGSPDYMKWVDLVEHEKSLCQIEDTDLTKYREAHKKEIEHIRAKKAIQAIKRAEEREKREIAENIDFAPPPEIWLKHEEKKEEKIVRKRKRISWKSTRREKQKKNLK